MKKNSFFQILRNYLTVYLPSQKCCSDDTIKSYKEALNCLIDYLRDEKGMKLATVSFDVFNVTVILDFLDWLQTTRNHSASTRNQRLMILRSFFRYAGMVDCSLIDFYLKLRDIPPQTEQVKVVEYLSEDALKALLEWPNMRKATEYRNAVFMTLMYDCAARCSELLDLRIQNLRLNSTHPIVQLCGKGNKVRLIPLMPQTVILCKEYMDHFHPESTRSGTDFFFFTSTHGTKRRMSSDNVAYFMKKYGEQAQDVCSDMPRRVHPHQLRHTRAIHLYQDGMPLSVISEFLGHASVETTKIYAYADTEMKRAAIQKAEEKRKIIPNVEANWLDDDAIMRKLCGLK